MVPSFSDQLLESENKAIGSNTGKSVEPSVKKPGEEGYVAPELKEGDEGYVASVLKSDNENGKKVVLKPGEEGYVNPNQDIIDLDDDKLLALLQKKNPNIKNLSDILGKAPELSEAEKVIALEQKKSKMLVYGLKSGAIKNDEQYRSYITDLNKSAREIALQAYKAEALIEDPEAEDEDIIKDFEDENFEHLAETDKRRIRATKAMEAAKQSYINGKYDSIVNLESDYEDVIQEEQDAVVYGSRIENIVSQIPAELPFEIKVGNKTLTYQYKVKPEILAEIKSMYKGIEYFKLFNQGKLKDDELKQTLLNSLQGKEFKNIIQEISTAHANSLLNDTAKGRRGERPERDDAGEGQAVGGGGISDQIINEQKN